MSLEDVHLNNELMLSDRHGYKSHVWLLELKEKHYCFSNSVINNVPVVLFFVTDF